MYLMDHERIRRELGNSVCSEIDVYVSAVEAELRRYVFGARATLTAEVRYAAALPEYPKLFIHLRWSAPVQGDKELHVMYDVPVRELSAMVRKDIPSMNMALVDHVCRFAERLLTELVLTLRLKPIPSLTGTGRTRVGPELQNIPAPRREQGW